MSKRANLDDLYFKWLYSQVGTSTVNLNRSYHLLAEQMHLTEFTWFVPNDDNRAVDGLELREEFLVQNNMNSDLVWDSSGCSFFEMLIALCRRLTYEAYGLGANREVPDWFRVILRNLDLDTCTDYDYTDDIYDHVKFTLSTVLSREYDPDGRGGLFPLRNCTRDQTMVEIWDQMSTYLLETTDIGELP